MVNVLIDRVAAKFGVNFEGETSMMAAELALAVACIHQGLKRYRSDAAAQNFRKEFTIAIVCCKETWEDDPHLECYVLPQKKSDTPTDQS